MSASARLRALQAAFEEGWADRRYRRGTWAAVALTMAVATVAAAVSAVMSVDREVTDGALVEAPVPEGGWAVPWTAHMEPPSAEQSIRLLSLRRAAAGVAGIVAVLGFLSVMALWQQRLRLRRRDDFVAWAVGARPEHFLARAAGEGWPWMVGGALTAAVAGAAAFGLMADTFPGAFNIPPDWAASVLVATGVAVALLRGEGRSGQAASRPGIGIIGSWASSPVTVAALGFAGLTGAGLLLAHGPHATGQPGSDRARHAVPPVVVTASLSGMSHQERALLLEGWRQAVLERTSPVGFASAGTVRGTGHRDRVWVDCGECLQGGLPLPIRTVAAEIHAVAPDTFARLGVAIREGRDFGEADGSTGAAVVSRSLAARHFQGGRALGRRLRVGESDWVTVVGVVEDRPDIRDHTDYTVYVPLAWAAPAEVEVLPAAGSEDALRATRPEGVVASDPSPGSTAFGALPWFRDLLRWLGLAAVALVVAGVRAGAEAEARAAAFELALRRALGADRGALRRFQALRTVRSVSAALGMGAFLSLFLGNALNEGYGGIPLMDPGVWATAAAVVLAAWLAGSAGQVRRASGSAPAQLLAPGE